MVIVTFEFCDLKHVDAETGFYGLFLRVLDLGYFFLYNFFMYFLFHHYIGLRLVWNRFAVRCVFLFLLKVIWILKFDQFPYLLHM